VLRGEDVGAVFGANVENATNPLGRLFCVSKGLESGTFVPLTVAFCTGGEIGINGIGSVFNGVGLANVGSGPQSNDTGAGIEVEV